MRPTGDTNPKLAEGDAVGVSFRDLRVATFHVERIAYGSVMVAVETWTGKLERVRVWPGDRITVETRGRCVAELGIVRVEDERVETEYVETTCSSPLAEHGGWRLRLRGAKLAQPRVRRVPDPARLIPMPMHDDA